MPRVFLSYSRQDKYWVEIIAQVLASHGVDVWYDQALGAGKDYRRDIQEALDGADIIAVIWTSDSLRSKWVLLEASQGFRTNKLLNIELRELAPPEFWRHPRVDLRFFDDFTGDWNFSRLIALIDAIHLKRHIQTPFQAPALGAQPEALLGAFMLHSVGLLFAVVLFVLSSTSLLIKAGFNLPQFLIQPPNIALVGIIWIGSLVSCFGYWYIFKVQALMLLRYLVFQKQILKANTVSIVKNAPNARSSKATNCKGLLFAYEVDDVDWASYLADRLKSVIDIGYTNNLPTNAVETGNSHGDFIAAICSSKSMCNVPFVALCEQALAQQSLIPALVDDIKLPDSWHNTYAITLRRGELFENVTQLMDAYSRLTSRTDIVSRSTKLPISPMLRGLFGLLSLASLFGLMGYLILSAAFVMLTLFHAWENVGHVSIPYLGDAALPMWLVGISALFSTAFLVFSCVFFFYGMVASWAMFAMRPVQRQAKKVNAN